MKAFLFCLTLVGVCMAPAWAAAKWLPISTTLVWVVLGLAATGTGLMVAAAKVILYRAAVVHTAR